MKISRITRPGMDALTNGSYLMTWKAAPEVYPRTSGESLGGTARFQDSDGNVLDTTTSLPVDWSPESAFRKMVDCADCLPEPNDDLDVSALLGVTFAVEVRLNTKNGRTYPNIVDVWLPEDEEE